MEPRVTWGWLLQVAAGMVPLPSMASLDPRSECPGAMETSRKVTIYKGEVVLETFSTRACLRTLRRTLRRHPNDGDIEAPAGGNARNMSLREDSNPGRTPPVTGITASASDGGKGKGKADRDPRK
ncbi:unnamed protein product [Ectocarpus sp. CCAP 1310/34]|nr:unnamed protein product [Ectocarpus sp. CCAP 1310/34]